MAESFTIRSTDDYGTFEGEKVMGENICISTWAGLEIVKTTWNKLDQNQKNMVVEQLQKRTRHIAGISNKSYVELIA